MPLHQSRNNSGKGFLLAAVTSLMWGTLPIALKIILPKLDPVTLTWYRFSLAAAILNGWLLLRRDWPARPGSRHVWGLWIAACLGLAGNHTMYVAGLSFLEPTAATVLIQLGPVFLLLGGLFVFKEQFSRLQWCGFAILITGMFVFFNNEIRSFSRLDSGFLTGTVLIVLASAAWMIYALAQKQLLVHYSSQHIVAVIYLAGTLLLLAGAHPMQISRLDSGRLALVIFCGLNTIIAYGCFSEALQNWAASRVGAVLSVIPVLTLVLMQIAHPLAPGMVAAETFTVMKTIGACIVVAGSMLCALGRRNSASAESDEPA